MLANLGISGIHLFTNSSNIATVKAPGLYGLLTCPEMSHSVIFYRYNEHSRRSASRSGLLLLRLRQLGQKLPWCENGRIGDVEFGEVPVARNQKVRAGDPAKKDQVVVVGVRRDPGLGRWIVHDDG